jgi:hypothetical protein
MFMQDLVAREDQIPYPIWCNNSQLKILHKSNIKMTITLINSSNAKGRSSILNDMEIEIIGEARTPLFA